MTQTQEQTTEDLFASALVSYQSRDWMATSQKCRKLLQSHPGHAPTLFLLATSLSKLGARDLAANILVSIVQTAGAGPRYLHVKALVRLTITRIRQWKLLELARFYYFLVSKALVLIRRRLHRRARR